MGCSFPSGPGAVFPGLSTNRRAACVPTDTPPPRRSLPRLKTETGKETKSFQFMLLTLKSLFVHLATFSSIHFLKLKCIHSLIPYVRTYMCASVCERERERQRRKSAGDLRCALRQPGGTGGKEPLPVLRAPVWKASQDGHSPLSGSTEFSRSARSELGGYSGH